MKNPILIIGAFLVSAIVFTSCKKDDDDTPQKNHFKVNDIEYELAAGAIENYGLWDEDGDVYNIDLNLFSTNLSITEDAYGYMDVSGSGQMLYFEMLTTTGASLDNGVYKLDTISPYPAGTFDYADYSINISDSTGGTNWMDIVSGQITVNKTGSIYSININCIDDEGKTITGYYSGALQYFDYDTKNKYGRIKSRNKH